MDANTTPPPPKLTVRAVFPGKVSSAQRTISSGAVPRSAAARSWTSTGLYTRFSPPNAWLTEFLLENDQARFPCERSGPDARCTREKLLVLRPLTSGPCTAIASAPRGATTHRPTGRTATTDCRAPTMHDL